MVEPGSETLTGKEYQHHVLGAWFSPSGELANAYNFYWKEVKYKTRVYLKRKLPVSHSILLFKDDKVSTLFYSLKENISIEQNLLTKILNAGYVAKNMTPDLVNLSIEIQQPSKFDFDKNNFTLYYNFGSYELTFVDGLLENIKLSPKMEDLSKYAGSYSSVSETGDSCKELVIKVEGGNLVALYRSWYCGEGGQPPEFEALSNASIKDGKFKGTTTDGYEVVWNLKK